MPKKIDLYDRGGEGRPAAILQRWPVDANEAVARAPERYSLSRPNPWPPVAVPLAPRETAEAAPTARKDAGGTTTGDDGAKPVRDPFLEVKGIGAGIARKLRASGVVTYAQLAAKSPDELAAIAATPGKTAKVIADAQWIEQARELAVDENAGMLLPDDEST